MKHQLLSERRFFAEFLGSPEPPATQILPVEQTIDALALRLVELASARLNWLSAFTEADWLRSTDFFDVQRERIWVFWRRVLQQFQHSGQGVRAFCEAHALSEPSFYAWRRILQERVRLGGALLEEVRFHNGAVTNPHFASYPVPRFKDVPQIDVHLVNRPDLASAGAGETPIVGIAPAVANAVFHATGVRVRAMPLRDKALKKA